MSESDRRYPDGRRKLVPHGNHSLRLVYSAETFSLGPKSSRRNAPDRLQDASFPRGNSGPIYHGSRLPLECDPHFPPSPLLDAVIKKATSIARKLHILGH